MSNAGRNKIITELFSEKPSFLIGAGASSHQVEGGNVNDWTEFEAVEGNIEGNEKSGLATNHYELYNDDFKLLESMGLQAHRLSIEWSRIFPKEDQINMEEVNHYRKVLTSLRSTGQIGIITLHHFTSPIWFMEKGGFKKKSNLKYWRAYVRLICEELGDLMDLINTINEPLVYCATGYLQGIHAPGERSFLSYVRVANNLTRAHFAAVAIIRELCPSVPVGSCKNMSFFVSKNRNPLNRIIRWISDWGFNRRPLVALKNSRIPFGFSKIKEGDLGDYIGLNFYLKIVIGSSYPDFMLLHDPDEENLTQMGWGVHPEGLEYVIKRVADIIPLPIIVTENGIATDDDERRIDYINSHLEAILNVTKEGNDVRGYIYWSYIDNFEWEKGFTPKFGLISYDPNTFERSVKPSGYYLGSIAKLAISPKSAVDFSSN
jgi:beta-glucosidase